MALSSRARIDLLFCIFFPGFPNPRAHRSSRNSAGKYLSPTGCAGARSLATVLVRTNSTLVIKRLDDVDRALLGGNDRVIAAGAEPLATRYARHLFRLLSLLCKRGTGLFKLSIGWNVA